MQNAPKPRQKAHTRTETTVADHQTAVTTIPSREHPIDDLHDTYAWPLFWLGFGATCAFLLCAHVVHRVAG